MPRDVAVNSNFLNMRGRTKRSTLTMLNSDLSMRSLHSSTSESATLIVPAICHSNSALLGENRRSAKLDVDVLNQHFAKPKPTSGPAKTALHQSSTSFHITNVTHVAASMSTGAQPNESNGQFLHEGPCQSSKGAQLVTSHRGLSTTVTTIDEKLAQLSAMPIENTCLHLRYRRNLRRARLLRPWLVFV